ncbi:putative plastid developmental protein DAG [Capsicum annuum]|uniref:Uncharacterized protein n=2 Tax=Capsicum annuum TaxID=4072 RepID=A0A2G3AFH4_CAPAN|nr:putative plastid developmental protein DAG [Capsicum annuum]KAF3662864.1 putative plastid developmental protein DAG [Capsicum annuum]PHT92960.1 hypothetical protein T459_00842 [Capsicum annuum]
MYETIQCIHSNNTIYYNTIQSDNAQPPSKDVPAEKARARTKEEKDIAEERRKEKEAEAKMELHESKAAHAGEKLEGKHGHGGHAPYSTHSKCCHQPSWWS